MVTKPKYTKHKIYNNIKVYQTNSSPKLVTTKTFFPLTWSSSPKSITPHEEWHSILKILPLVDTIVKGHKRLKNLTGDRQKTDIEGTRRTRNHRPTRKRKTRCYWHKGKKKKKKQNKRKMKCMQGYLDRSRRCQEVSTTGSRWIEVAIEHLESFSMDQSSYWECQKNSWRVLIDSNLLRAIEKLSRWAKIVFQRRGK